MERIEFKKEDGSFGYIEVPDDFVVNSDEVEGLYPDFVEGMRPVKEDKPEGIEPMLPGIVEENEKTE